MFGKMNPFSRAYFSKGLVQPPARIVFQDLFRCSGFILNCKICSKMYCWGLTPVYVPDNYQLVFVGDELFRNSLWGYQIEFSLILALVYIGTLPKITMLNRRCIERNGSLSSQSSSFSGKITLRDQVKTTTELFGCFDCVLFSTKNCETHRKIITDPKKGIRNKSPKQN